MAPWVWRTSALERKANFLLADGGKGANVIPEDIQSGRPSLFGAETPCLGELGKSWNAKSGGTLSDEGCEEAAREA